MMQHRDTRTLGASIQGTLEISHPLTVERYSPVGRFLLTKSVGLEWIITREDRLREFV
jgi:hypothetical protein